MMRRRMIEVPGGAVAGIEFGPAGAPLVLFLHANGFNALTYRHALAPLGEAARVFAIDLRGHGRSTLPAHSPTPGWQIFADDLLALIDAIGEIPRIIAGHSMGGTASLLAAPRLPSTRIVLFDPVILPRADYGAAPPDYASAFATASARRKSSFPDHATAFGGYRSRAAFAAWPDDVLRDYLEDGLRPAADGGVTLTCPPAWETRNFAEYCQSDPYPGLSANVRVLRAGTQSMTALPESAQVRTVPGTTHFLPMERPDSLRDAILEVFANE
jgi:pimeloyl-ACP methyl ester carboxylesterase